MRDMIEPSSFAPPGMSYTSYRYTKVLYLDKFVTLHTGIYLFIPCMLQHLRLRMVDEYDLVRTKQEIERVDKNSTLKSISQGSVKGVLIFLKIVSFRKSEILFLTVIRDAMRTLVSNSRSIDEKI